MKTMKLEGVGDVIIRKSARAKRFILKIDANGRPVATIPKLVPYIAAERFIQHNRAWLEKNVTKTNELIANKTRIGRQHKLTYVASRSEKVSSRVSKSVINISVPEGVDIMADSVQQEARRAATRALRKEAEAFLPSRLHTLARLHNYSYREVRIKAAQTRWGSCSQKQIINLSIWLMQLPDELIDYVICHELTHLHHMHHQKAFWAELATMIPDYKTKRIDLKQYRPALAI